MKTTTYLSILLLSLSFTLSGQNRLPSSVAREYKSLSYMKTTKTLEHLVEKGTESKEIYQKLGNAYYYNSKMEAASTWYGQLFEKYEDIDSEYLYRYAMSLKSQGDYTKSNMYMQKFAKSNPSDKRAQLYLASPNYLTDIANKQTEFVVENMALNTSYSDFGSSFYNQGIVFASSRDTDQNTYSWNEQPYLELYYSEDLKQGNKLKGAVNTKYHESSTSFTKDGETMYFTRNNYYKGKRRTSKEKINGLKIYRATLKDGSWEDVTSLPFNSDDYNVAHPALSADEKYLYFSSDMNGSVGQSDIYRVSIDAEGNYGTPENLGNKINTEGRENFPYVSADGTLYFSSDGHLGLGGLDVFRVDVNSKKQDVINLGKPINSAKDDFEYIVNASGTAGYLTSNREGGKGDDDIYRFYEKEEEVCKLLVSGVVKSTSGELLSNATIKVYDSENTLVQELETDAQGAYSYEEDCDTGNYRVVVEKGGFEMGEATLKTDGKTDKILEIALSQKESEATGTDLATTLNLLPIYFDYGKSEIRPDAAMELDKVVDYMKRFPTVRVDVRSHTDSRGNSSYNRALSERRNRSTRGYLIAKGIASNRLTGRGYGESQLVNRCRDGVTCSETEHQKNRRSEFIVIGR